MASDQEYTDDIKQNNPAMYTFAEDTALPGDIDGVLGQGMWYDLFYRYAKAQFAENNLDFMRKAAEYNSSPGVAQGQALYDAFCTGGQEINLPGGIRGPLDAIYGPNIDPANVQLGDANTWDDAVAETKRMLARDSLPRFNTVIKAIQDAKTADVDWDNVEGRPHS